MACNCKNTITSFLGGDVPNPTTFLNCGEADGTYNNPLETGKTQCIAENNVLRILDEYKISGTVKNAGKIIFERTVTASTLDSTVTDEWANDGTYFLPKSPLDGNLSATTLITSSNIKAGGTLVITGNTVMNGTLSATTQAKIGNGDGIVSANTFTSPSTLFGVSRDTGEIGVVTATTVAAKYSGSVITNASDRTITMTVDKFRPGMVIEVDMGAGSGDITINTPELSQWYYGKYTFLFPAVPNVGGVFVINGGGSEKFYGLTMCLDGNEIINGADTITFGGGKTTAGTKIEIISTKEDRTMMYITSTSNKADITPS